MSMLMLMLSAKCKVIISHKIS